MIKNIIFDMGNVLLNFDPEITLHQQVASKEDRDIIRRELFQGPEWEMGDYGILTNEERYEPVSKRVPERLHKELKACVDNWQSTLTPVPGAAEFCEYVKKKGYGIYVLSNADTGLHTYFPAFKEEAYFNGVMVSADVHMIKPDVKIFEHFLKTFSLDPSECLFIDDRAENAAAAETTGMTGYIFQNDYDAIKEKFEF